MSSKAAVLTPSRRRSTSEAKKFPKPGEAVDSASGLAWALVRV
jgi:hypothetical protein